MSVQVPQAQNDNNNNNTFCIVSHTAMAARRHEHEGAWTMPIPKTPERSLLNEHKFIGVDVLKQQLVFCKADDKSTTIDVMPM